MTSASCRRIARHPRPDHGGHVPAASAPAAAAAHVTARTSRGRRCGPRGRPAGRSPPRRSNSAGRSRAHRSPSRPYRGRPGRRGRAGEQHWPSSPAERWPRTRQSWAPGRSPTPKAPPSRLASGPAARCGPRRDRRPASTGLDPATGGSAAAGLLAVIVTPAPSRAVTAFVATLRAASAASRRGMPPRASVVVLHAPRRQGTSGPVGPVPSLALMRAVKEQFDPDRLLAPAVAGGI